jgi:hypothetical protein
MMRFWIFAKSFPQLAAYIPHWNGGRVAAHTVSSGATAPGLLLWPLWRFGAMEEVYTPGLILIFLVLAPAAAVVSVRLCGGSWTAGACAGILAVGISRFAFLWLLHFGTVASNTSAIFIMPVCAVLYRVLWLDRRELWAGAILVISSVLFLAWPASAIIAMAIVPGVVCSARRWSRPNLIFLAACAGAIAVLCLPQVLTILRVTDVGGFSKINTWQDWSFWDAFLKGFSVLADHGHRAHPVLVIFGLLGVWFLPAPGMRWLVGPVLVGLAIVSGWGAGWKPQFSLARAGIPLFYLAALPAGFWLGQILRQPGSLWAPARALVLAVLIFGGLETAKIYANRTQLTFRAMPADVRELIAWIRTHTPEGGRVLFAGETVHGVGGGHVAVLPVLTGREMMACDYYHFSPQKVAYEYPPPPFHLTTGTTFEFLELYNVTQVITHHPRWKEVFRADPDRYEEQFTFGERAKKTVFTVKREPGLFLQGSGRVTADVNRITVQLDDPTLPAVIKYNWAEDLQADEGVGLEPHDAGRGVRLIALRPNGRSNVVIRYKGPR